MIRPIFTVFKLVLRLVSFYFETSRFVSDGHGNAVASFLWRVFLHDLFEQMHVNL